MCGTVCVVNMGKAIFHKSFPFDIMLLKMEPSFETYSRPHLTNEGVTKTQTPKTQTSDPENSDPENSDPLKSKLFSILFT